MSLQIGGRWAKPVYAIAGLIAFALKAHYSRASAGELAWILAPTAALVGWVRGEPLRFVASIGWLPADDRFVIAPACAGVNFLIVMFVTGVWGFAGRFRSMGRRAAWLAAMLVGAYGLTLAVNVLRITAAVALYDAELHAGWFTAERVHRLAGTVIYLGTLSVAWLALRRFTGPNGRANLQVSRPHQRVSYRGPARREPRPPSAGFALPSLAYITMTVMVPLANGAWRQLGGPFIEHALTVSLLALIAGLLLSIPALVTSRTKDGADGQTDDLGGRRRAGNR